MRWLKIGALVVCAACDGGETSDTAIDTGPDGRPLPDCDASGFEQQAQEWSLPFTMDLGNGRFAGLSSGRYALVDFTGDARPDLVLIRDFRDEPDALVGRNHWLVFENTGDGFADEPIQWQLPYSLVGRVPDANALASLRHSVTDIDGDGLVDFVVTRNGEQESSDALLGRAHWLVFPNTGSGFETTPTQWSLPFSLLESRDNSALATESHAVMVLDDVGAPGLLVVRDDERAAAERDPLVGSNHWLFFPPQGSGFANEPMQWALPYALTGTNNLLATRGHALVDLRGEGVPDFVVVNDDERADADALVGTNHWLIFENIGSGFDADPVEWELPFSLRTAGSNVSELATATHQTSDVTGDARPDFVLRITAGAAEDDPLAGRSHWPVHKNTGSGFGSEPRRHALPYPLLTDSGNNNAWVTDRHTVLDIDGDGLVDFVEIINGEREETDPLLGRNHWRVYPGACQ